MAGEASAQAAASARAVASRAVDPEHPAWDGVRRAVICAAEAVALAVQEMRHALPADDRRVEMAELCAGALDGLRGPLEAIVIDEAIIEARESRAYDKGMADGLAAARRCGQHRDNPGHLRPVTGS